MSPPETYAGTALGCLHPQQYAAPSTTSPQVLSSPARTMAKVSVVGIRAQAIWKATCAVAPEVTVSVAGFSPDNLQLAATPLSTTVWSPANSCEKVTDPLMASACPAPPSTATV